MKKKLNIRSLMVALGMILMMNACSEKKFEKSGWTEKTDANFPPNQRKEMLSDLLSNHKLVGMKYADVLTLLGAPDDVDSSSLSYEVEIDYGSDIDPIYRKDLYLLTSKDSIIISYEVKEWKRE